MRWWLSPAAQRQQHFEEVLRLKLAAELNVVLVSATLGRGRQNEPFWDLSLRNICEAWTERVRLQTGEDPFPYDAVSRVRDSVHQAMPDRDDEGVVK